MKISCRLPGFIYGYTGTMGTAQGWLEDFDGKWVYLSLDTFRTIGAAASGAHLAYDWLQFLFIHLWSNYDNTQCTVLTSAGISVARGSSASADWAANKRLLLPDFRGRAVMSAGTGASLTSRAKGTVLGVEQVSLTVQQIPPHYHSIVMWNNVSDYSHLHTSINTGLSAPASNATSSGLYAGTENQGGGQAHNNMPPAAVEHLLISTGMR